MNKKMIALTVNGDEKVMLASPGDSLLNVLRDELRMTGTRCGCSEGGCGACTVVVDGKPVFSCLTAVETINGASVDTIEGLGSPEELDVVQQAFLDAFATQCGFCSPGMIIAVKSLLDKNAAPSRKEVARAISGNICRCTGYEAIIDAAILAGERMSSAALQAAE
ncbi:MAG: (2Fe-2S)-binding protein [Hyphomicrobiales bacterium]|nr:(2Fe-2S)-binding protein [Hyphomicrobiales bacterium]PCJ85702.1 MAG: (2Fe-2S)-binding protein [Hyphomicrobiales bacterium]